MIFTKTLTKIVCYAALAVGTSAAALAQAPAKKTAPVAVPVYCAVTGEKLASAKDAAATRTVAGKKYYTCCPGCSPKFDAAPAKYARIADLRETKRGLEAKLAQLNADLKVAEAVSTPKKAAEVTATPAASPVYCAVTGEKIASAQDAFAKETYNNKTYYLCCAGCVPAFKASPAKYAEAADKRDAAKVN